MNKTRLILITFLFFIISQSCKKDIRPTIKTLHPTNVTETSVKLNGNINPNGSYTNSLKFEYGTTTLYGNTCTLDNVSGNNLLNVSFEIQSELIPDLTYHYRLVATNSAGISLGDDEIFTTSKPPTLITYAATDITSSSATLNGGINPNGGEYLVQFEYIIPKASNSQAYGYVNGATLTNVYISPTGLESNTTYHYRINAYRQSDEAFFYGNEEIFITKQK